MSSAGHHSMMGGAGVPQEKYILRLANGIDLRCNAMIPDGDMTISFWYKGYARGANNEVYQFGWRESAGWGGTRALFPSSQFMFRYSTGSSATSYTTTNGAGYATDQTWHHFAFRKNGTSIVVMCDGTALLEKTADAQHKNDGTPLSIGSLGNDSDSQYRRGVKSIGMFCLFDRALSDLEITQLAAIRTLRNDGGLFSGLVCGYELSSDTQLADVTGNYPLTLYNRAGESVEYSDLLPA